MAGKDAAENKDGADAEGGGKKKLIMIVAGVLLMAGGGWFFFLRGGGEEVTELPPPVAGEMVELEPITINLAGGHYLKLGMALQAIEGGHGKQSGAKALDAAIALFSGKTLAELSTTTGRTKAKAELTARIKLAYLPHTEEAESAASESSSSHDEEEGSADEEESSSHDEESSSDEEEASDEEHSEESSGGHGHDYASMSAEQVIEAAEKLTVQPEVYEVYFTEFVMQ